MTLGNYDTLHPYVRFRILSGPKNVTARELEERLVTFEYINEPKKFPRFEMGFDNSDGKAMNLAVLILGLKLRITWGYDGLLTKRPYDAVLLKIKGTAVRAPDTISPMGGAAGVVTMVANCHKVSSHSRVKDNWRFGFRNARVSQLALKAALSMGYRKAMCYIEGLDTSPNTGSHLEDPRLDYWELATDESLWQGLERLADSAGLEFYVEGDEFHMHSPEYPRAPVIKLNYFAGPDLLEWGIEGDYKINLQGVTAVAHDRRKNVVYTYDSKTQKPGVATTELKKVLKRPAVTPIDVIKAVKPNARRRAMVRLKRNALNRWKLKLKLVGDPRIFRGTVLHLDNFGLPIDGRWTVHAAKHTIDDNGYTTELQLKGTGRGTSKTHPRTIKYTYDPVSGKMGVAVDYHGPIKMKKKGRKKKGRARLSQTHWERGLDAIGRVGKKFKAVARATTKGKR